jgi:hypothetical protein
VPEFETTAQGSNETSITRALVSITSESSDAGLLGALRVNKEVGGDVFYAHCEPAATK